MKHFAGSHFWKSYERLPQTIQKLADKNYKLLKHDSTHPSLNLKRVGQNNELWSVRVGIGYRALGRDKPEGIVWFWIGAHADYDRLIS